ncbi:MAG: hypothetical protein PWQ89_1192 [Verrucomicrobiota bacterium]|nr:hypothetical protein [Verrucomicrobiota bacterium]
MNAALVTRMRTAVLIVLFSFRFHFCDQLKSQRQRIFRNHPFCEAAIPGIQIKLLPAGFRHLLKAVQTEILDFVPVTRTSALNPFSWLF